MDSLPTSQDLREAATSPPAVRRDLGIARRAMAVLWTLIILILCLLPGELVKEVEGESPFFAIPNLDKVVHWALFAGFSVLWLRVGGSRRRYAWVALAGIALGAVTEIVQSIPAIGRDAEVSDFLTDLIGVAIGIAIARLAEPFLSLAESCIFPEPRG